MQEGLLKEANIRRLGRRAVRLAKRAPKPSVDLGMLEKKKKKKKRKRRAMQKTAQQIAHEVIIKVAKGTYQEVDPELVAEHARSRRHMPLAMGGALGVIGAGMGAVTGGMMGGARGAGRQALSSGLFGAGIGAGGAALINYLSNKRMLNAPYNEGYAKIWRKGRAGKATPEDAAAYDEALRTETPGDLSTWDQFK